MKISIYPKYSFLGASSRVRMYNYARFLKNDFNITYSCLLDDDYIRSIYTGSQFSKINVMKSYVRRLFHFLRSVLFADMIWLEKELFPYVPLPFELISKLFGKKLVLEYDDAIYENYKCSCFSRMFDWKFNMLAKYSDLIICGNPTLQSFFVSNGAKTKLIPTVIDLDKYKIREGQSEDVINIGWIGTPNTQKFIGVIDPVVSKLQKKYNVNLLLIGANECGDFQSDITYIDWSDKTEVDSLNMIDIGVMPLFDGEFEKGKCGYKLIQYMALAKPVLASPIGVNEQIIKHGENGYLCRNDDDWYHYLERLILDSQLAKKMGLSGLDIVKSGYTYQSQYRELLKAFGGLLSENGK